MKVKNLIFAGSLLLGVTLSASAEDFAAKVKGSMAALKGKCTTAKIEGTAKVSGKDVPALYCNNQVVNMKFTIVDQIKKEHAGTATLFVKSGEEFVRVSTNVMKDGESRAVGTQLARNKAYETISKGEEFYGQVEILGTPYETGYAPIKDGAGKTIGIYYVGYPLK